MLGVSFVGPKIIRRLETSSLSFEDRGSFDLRIKLASEAINLIEQYPLFGVGLNNFVFSAKRENITGVYSYSDQQVHNLLMLIATEIGVPGAVFFILFIFNSYLYYFKNRDRQTTENKFFKDAAAIGGLVYLMETLLNISFLAPHYYLFHLFMAILVI